MMCKQLCHVAQTCKTHKGTTSTDKPSCPSGHFFDDAAMAWINSALPRLLMRSSGTRPCDAAHCRCTGGGTSIQMVAAITAGSSKAPRNILPSNSSKI